jgi:hypothetical protein
MGCGVDLRRATQQEEKEDNVVERFIGYIVSFVVLAGMGLGLPRWFAWRRSLVNRLQDQPEDSHV